MVIDFHAHIVPDYFPPMMERSGGKRWPVMRCTSPDCNDVIISGKIFRTVTDQCWNVSRRLEDMLTDGVKAQVLSPMPELLSYWFEAKDALYFSHFINAQISEMVQQAPNQFFGLGMLPLQDPKLSATQIPRLKKDFGLYGVEVGSNINGKVIGDPYFEPFYEAAESEGIVIFVHALHPLGLERIVGTSALEVALGFPTETAYAITSLITGGMLDKYPNLKLVFSHGGGTFAQILPRLIQAWHKIPSIKQAIKHHPKEYAQRLFYDTLVYDDTTLKFLIDSFGASQLVIGSDYPFNIMQENVGSVLDKLELSEEDREAIAFNNALRLLEIRD